MKIVLTTFIAFLIMSAYSLIIVISKPPDGAFVCQDMNRVTFSSNAVCYAAALRRRCVSHYRDGQFHNQLPAPGSPGRKYAGGVVGFLMTNGKRPSRATAAAGEDRSGDAAPRAGRDGLARPLLPVPAAGGKTHPDRPGVQRLRGAPRNKAFPATIRGGRKGCRRSIC